MFGHRGRHHRRRHNNHSHPTTTHNRYLTEQEVCDLCIKAKEILVDEGTVTHVSAPVTICGDIHGQFYDLKELFKKGGLAPDTSCVVFRCPPAPPPPPPLRPPPFSPSAQLPSVHRPVVLLLPLAVLYLRRLTR
jgi:hypothetical protein